MFSGKKPCAYYKYALINGMRLLDDMRLLDGMWLQVLHLIIQQIMASLTDEDAAVYLHKSVVRGHHIYKRVWSPKYECNI